MHGLLLFAHGARDPAWSRPFEAIAAQMRPRHPDGPIALAYLELMQPSLPDAVAQLVAAGCTRITVLPMFLGAGGHVRRDLPLLIEAQRQAHPDLRLDCSRAIGEAEVVHQALADAALQLAREDGGDA